MTSPAERPAHHPTVLAEAKKRSDDVQLRIADLITKFAGSMAFVYLHAVIFIVWMLFVEGSPWPTLTLVVSLEAIFLSTFVMIGQNRQADFQQHKADHDFVTNEQQLKTNTDLTRLIARLTQEIHETVHAQPGPAGPGSESAGACPRDLGVQRLPQQRRGRVHCVGQVEDLDAERREVGLQLVALGGTAPVVALDDDVEVQPFPHLELARDVLLDGLVDEADAADDLQPLGERDDRCLALGPGRHLVGDDAGDEVVTRQPRVPQDVQVPDVEHVVDTWCIADSFRHSPTPVDVRCGPNS